MGAPFDTGTWNGVEGAYFTGAGGGSMLFWLIVAIVLCVLPLVLGHKHESERYKKMED